MVGWGGWTDLGGAGVFLAALPRARTGGEGEAVGVEGEALALEGAEGAGSELVFLVGGGRVVVGVWLWNWLGIFGTAVVSQPGRAAKWTGERYSRCSHHSTVSMDKAIHLTQNKIKINNKTNHPSRVSVHGPYMHVTITDIT